MAARFTGDVSCFATSMAAHPVPAHEVAIRCEFEDGLARDRNGFGGFIETALAMSAWKLGRTRNACQAVHRSPVRPTLCSGELCSGEWVQADLTHPGLILPGRRVGVSHGGNAWPVTHGKQSVDVGHGWAPVRLRASLRVRSQGTDSTIEREAVRQSPFPHESHACVSTTINFRQPSCPLDFCPGGMDSHQCGRFLLKPIEETAQCIVTIRD